MPKLDSEGFIVNEMGQPHERGVVTADDGGVIDILYKKAKSRKWFILFFSLVDFTDVIQKIEYSYYAPKSDRNKGFELSILMHKNTTLVFCYKQYMTPEQLRQIFAEGSNRDTRWDPANDIAFLRMRGEPAPITAQRWAFFEEFMDYCRKQQLGE